MDTLNQSAAHLEEHFKDPVFGAKLLKGIFIFARFTEDELAQLYAIGQLVKLQQKANAVIEGEPTRGMFILLRGNVSVY